MKAQVFGAPGTLQRYITFGIIGGLAAGGVASLLNLELWIVTVVGGLGAGWLAGIGGGPQPKPAKTGAA